MVRICSERIVCVQKKVSSKFLIDVCKTFVSDNISVCQIINNRESIDLSFLQNIHTYNVHMNLSNDFSDQRYYPTDEQKLSGEIHLRYFKLFFNLRTSKSGVSNSNCQITLLLTYCWPITDLLLTYCSMYAVSFFTFIALLIFILI